MKRMKLLKGLLVLAAVFTGMQECANAQGRTRLPLNGSWTFALDPVRSGEAEGWYRVDYPSAKFDPVVVPHCFSVDKRYELYTGRAWYFKRWEAVAAPQGTHQFLHFDAIFYKSRIWLNGELVGEHEGGYTPFELEVTGKLRDQNVLAVEVDNSWDTTTIPGAKTPVPYQSANMSQVYPWINYGGITRPVQVVTRPGLYVRNIKIVTEPDLRKGSARVKVLALLRNAGGAGVKAGVRLRIYREGRNWNKIVTGKADVTAGADGLVSFETLLSPAEVELWDQDHPNLYSAEVSVGSDTMSVPFGIRKLEIQGSKLLLNGEAIRMGGANRPLDHPEFGSMDPASVLEKDLGLMKGGCMELSRINHYAVSEDLLNWADRNGLLIIEEAGNWQMTPKQMKDTMMRRNWQTQMREMVERDWNHPCILAWSVGNEFQSQLQEGKDWVKDMRAFTRAIDSSRFITFASMMLGRGEFRTGADEASQYVDFVSANIYGNHLKVLQRIHALYPDKPVFVSEFGIRTDQVKEESERVKHLQDAMAAFRQCDFVIGASVWTLQDYRSRFPGTNINGYRPWGLVGPQREIRGMYTAWQEEFAPAVVERVGGTTIRVTARNNFPSYTLRNYVVRCNGQTVSLRTLAPGESQEISFDSGAGEVELVKPGGFVILRKVLP
jgi:beta-glucuronidase